MPNFTGVSARPRLIQRLLLLKAAISRRLDRLIRQNDRLERNQAITSEALTLFIRSWLTASHPIPPEALPAAIRHGYLRVADEVVGQPLLTLAELERQAILRSAHACKGQVSLMARQLGISERSLYRRLKVLPVEGVG